MNFNEYKALMTAVVATVRSRIVSIEEFPDCGAGPKTFHVTGECSPQSGMRLWPLPRELVGSLKS